MVTPSDGELREQRRRAARETRRPTANRTQFQVQDSAGNIVAVGKSQQEADELVREAPGLKVVRSRVLIEEAATASDITTQLRDSRDQAAPAPTPIPSQDFDDEPISSLQVQQEESQPDAFQESVNELDDAILADVGPVDDDDLITDTVTAVDIVSETLDFDIEPVIPEPIQEPTPRVTAPVAPATLQSSVVNKIQAEFGQAQQAVLRGVSPGDDLNNAERLANLRAREFLSEYDQDIAGLRTRFKVRADFFPRAIASANRNISNLQSQDRRGRFIRGNNLTPEQRIAAVEDQQARIVDIQRQQAENTQAQRDFDTFARSTRSAIQTTLNDSLQSIPQIVQGSSGEQDARTLTTSQIRETIEEAGGVSQAIESGALDRSEAISIGISDADFTSVGTIQADQFPAGTRFQLINQAGESAGFTSGQDGINVAIQQGFTVQPVSIDPFDPTAAELRQMDSDEAEAIRTAPVSDAQQVRDGGFGLDFATEDFEGGIDEPAEQDILEQDRLIAEREVLAEQLDVLTGERLFASTAVPVQGLGSPSAARAASGIETARFVAERQDRRQQIAEQGIPEDIAARQAQLADDVDFFVKATTASGFGIATSQQKEFESANRQLRVVEEVIAKMESGELSIAEGTEIVNAIPAQPTDSDIQSAENLLTAQIRIAGTTPVAGAFIGPVATLRDWEKSGPIGRSVDITLDVIGVAGLVLPAVGAARTAGATTGIARAGKIAGAVTEAEILGPSLLLADPIGAARGTVRTLFDPAEVILRRARVAGLEQSTQTLRLSAGGGSGDIGTLQSEEISTLLRSGEISAVDVKNAVTEATGSLINGQPARVRIGQSEAFIEASVPAAQRTTGPAAFSASPDIRNVIGSGLDVQGSEGGLFVSFSPHTRFAEATSTGAKAPDLNSLTRLQDNANRLESAGSAGAAEARQEANKALASWESFNQRISPQTRQLIEQGNLPNEPVPGIIWIRDQQLLSQLQGSESLPGGARAVSLGDPGNVPKIFQGKAEFEQVLPNGAKLPAASQTLFMRGIDGKRYGIAVIGKPLTSTEIAALKISGSSAAVQNVFAPPISIRSASLDSSQQLLRQADSLKAEATIAETAGDLRRAESLLERSDIARAQGIRAVVDSADTANILRIDSAQDADLRADELQRISANVLPIDNRVTSEYIRDLRAQAADARAASEIIRDVVGDIEQGRNLIASDVDPGGNENVRIRTNQPSDERSVLRSIGGNDIPSRRDSLDGLERLTPEAASPTPRTPGISPDQERLNTPVELTPVSRAPVETPELARIAAPPIPPRRQEILPLPVRPPVRRRIPGRPDAPDQVRVPSDVTPPRIRVPDPTDTPPFVPPQTPPRRSSDDSQEDDISTAQNLRSAGINRGFLDTTVDFTTGQVRTFQDLPFVPEGPTRGTFTPLTFSEAEPSLQRIPWGANDLIIGPFGRFKWIKAKSAMPDLSDLQPASEFKNKTKAKSKTARKKSDGIKTRSSVSRRRGRSL